jgi:DNA-binding NarL/FixJ family response regulator
MLQLRLLKQRHANGVLTDDDYERQRIILIDALTGTAYSGANKKPQRRKRHKKPADYAYSSDLYFAARDNNVTRVKDLLADGCWIDQPEPDTGDTPLIAAAKEGQRHVTEYLLREGADPDARSKRGYTALMVLVQQRVPLVDLACYLVSHGGANLDVPDSGGFTALDKCQPWVRRRLEAAAGSRRGSRSPSHRRRAAANTLDVTIGEQFNPDPIHQAVRTAVASEYLPPSSRQSHPTALIDGKNRGGDNDAYASSSAAATATPFSVSELGPNEPSVVTRRERGVTSLVAESTYLSAAGNRPRSVTGARVDPRAAPAGPARQEVMRIYLSNDSYKAFIVKSSMSARDVCAIMSDKIGLEAGQHVFLDLVNCIKEDERRVDPDANVFAIKAQWPTIFSSQSSSIEPCRFKVLPTKSASDAIHARYRNATFG